MQAFAVAALLIAATSARSTPIRARDIQSKYTILPTQLASHDVNKGDNVFALNTITVRNNGIETSTLYEVEFADALAGLTCVGDFFAGRATDSFQGTSDLDFFTTGIEDLDAQENGNLRDQPIARINFVAIGEDFTIDPTVTASSLVTGFPCPAGQTLVLESVAVGDFDVVTVGQDLSGQWTPAAGRPNGLSFIAY